MEAALQRLVEGWGTAIGLMLLVWFVCGGPIHVLKWVLNKLFGETKR